MSNSTDNPFKQSKNSFELSFSFWVSSLVHILTLCPLFASSCSTAFIFSLELILSTKGFLFFLLSLSPSVTIVSIPNFSTDNIVNSLLWINFVIGSILIILSNIPSVNMLSGVAVNPISPQYNGSSL